VLSVWRPRKQHLHVRSLNELIDGYKHGNCFGEESLFSESSSMSRALVHIPLYLREANCSLMQFQYAVFYTE
jgi:hypothetical protein